MQEREDETWENKTVQERWEIDDEPRISSSLSGYSCGRVSTYRSCALETMQESAIERRQTEQGARGWRDRGKRRGN